VAFGPDYARNALPETVNEAYDVVRLKVVVCMTRAKAVPVGIDQDA
jgi:hypothetical protein